jgi:hypothetical protein
MTIAEQVVDALLECNYSRSRSLRKKVVRPKPKADTNPMGAYGAPGMMAMPSDI